MMDCDSGYRQHKRRLVGGRWKRLRLQIFARDDYRCTRCGRMGRLECDHIKPVRAGGAMWSHSNLQTLCRQCHIEKTAKENNRQPESAAVQAWRSLVDRRKAG